MALLLLIGCLLVAYSLPVVLFVATTASRPQLLVLTVTSSFVWLLSFLLTSFLWSLLPHDSDDSLRNETWPLVLMGSFFQEVVRLLLLLAYTAYARSFSVVGLHALLFPLTDLFAAIALGVGFAFAHTLVVYGSVLAYAGEWGALYLPSSATTCPGMSVFPVTAWSACLFGAFHIALMIVQLDSVRRRDRRKWTTPITLHLIAAVAVILSPSVRWGCYVSLALLGGVTSMAVALAWGTIQRSDYASRKRR